MARAPDDANPRSDGAIVAGQGDRPAPDDIAGRPPPPFTHRELERCAEREVALRRNVYRKRGMTEERKREIAMMDAIAAHFKSLADENTALLGGTGDFPSGRLSDDDEGALNIAIGLEGETVMLRFGKKVAWIGLPKAEALRFALSILKYATGSKELFVTEVGPVPEGRPWRG